MVLRYFVKDFTPKFCWRSRWLVPRPAANFFDLLVCLKNLWLFSKKIMKSGIFGVYWPCWLLFWLFCLFSLPKRLLEIEAGAEADSNFFDGLRSLLLSEVVWIMDSGGLVLLLFDPVLNSCKVGWKYYVNIFFNKLSKYSLVSKQPFCVLTI